MQKKKIGATRTIKEEQKSIRRHIKAPTHCLNVLLNIDMRRMAQTKVNHEVKLVRKMKREVSTRFIEPMPIPLVSYIRKRSGLVLLLFDA